MKNKHQSTISILRPNTRSSASFKPCGPRINNRNRLSDTSGTVQSGYEWPQPARPLQQAWAQLVEDRGPYVAMVTMGFVGSYTDESLFKATNRIIFGVNRKLFGKHFVRNNEFLSGFAAAEQNQIGLNRGDLHFHMLIKSFRGVISDTAVNELRNKIIYVLPRVVDASKREMTSMSRVKVRLVTDQHGAAGYVTKEVGTERSPNGDHMGILGPNGIEFLGFDRMRHRLVG